MRLLCSIFFICCTTAAFAQTKSRLALMAKLSALALADPNTPVLQPGLEVKRGTKWSLQAEIGIPIKFLANEIVPQKMNHRYSKWRSEAKYFPVRRQAGSNKDAEFLALEVFGVKQHYEKERGRYVDMKTGIDYFFDTATIHRRTKGFCFKYGYVFVINKNSRLTMETAGGIGLRAVHIRFSNFANLREYNPGILAAVVNAFRISRNDEFEGTKTRIHLAASLKFGYRLF